MISITNDGKDVIIKFSYGPRVLAEAHVSPDDVMNQLILNLAAHAMLVKNPEKAKKSLETIDEKQKNNIDKPAFDLFMEDINQMYKEVVNSVKGSDSDNKKD